MRKDAEEAISNGERVRFKYFTGSVAVDAYSDEHSLAESGTDLWTSGLFFPMNDNFSSSEDPVLVQQGKAKATDRNMYVTGTVDTSGTWRVGIGSPPREEYALIPGGVQAYYIKGEVVYKRLSLEFLTLGSLAGEP